MFSLIKYDWLRRWKFFLAGIVTFLAVNFDLVFRIPRQQGPGKFSVLLCSLLFALVLFLLLDHIGRIYRPLFTDEAFWELTLPLNGYQFLSARLLAVAIELAAVILFVALVLYLDLMYLNRILLDWQLASITGELLLNFLRFVGFALGMYIIFMLMVYLSLVLAKSLFGSFKHGKTIAFGSFLVIAKIVDYLMNFWQVNSRYGINNPGFNITVGFNVASWEWLMLIVVIGILFGTTAYLLEKKINL